MPRTAASCVRTIGPISSSAPACMPTALIRSRSMYSVPHLKKGIFSIAGDDKPAEVVRSRFMKLNADHICFVLKCLAENSSPIRNMKQYLLASLYNAPTTMQLSYQNQTNHDLAMRR